VVLATTTTPSDGWKWIGNAWVVPPVLIPNDAGEYVRDKPANPLPPVNPPLARELDRALASGWDLAAALHAAPTDAAGHSQSAVLLRRGDAGSLVTA